MNQIINQRYLRKVTFQSVSASKTTHVQLKLSRKESADSDKGEGFRYVKFLPKLQTNFREHQQKMINYSTDIKRLTQPDRTIFYKSQKRQILNFTKFSSTSDIAEDNSKKFAVITKQGKRPYNQDRYICKVKNLNLFPRKNLLFNRNSYDLYGIFDGHGGHQCAQFLKDNFPIFLSRSKQLQTQPEEALKQAFQKAQQKFITTTESKNVVDTSGSCAVVCLIVGQKIVVANLGDSRALLLSTQNILELTKDHKPHDISQKMRIIKHGGKIYRQQDSLFKQIKLFRQIRILPGNLNVSRTIGDIEIKLKKYGGLPGMISSVPDIATHYKNNYQILLMGSDGLFQAFSNAEIQLTYSNFIRQHSELSKQKMLNQFIDQLSMSAESKSSDNITIIGVYLS